jgi:hypothetical protein
MEDNIRSYLAEIGRRGGRRSRRSLDPATAREMVRLREARRAFRKFYARCFWSSPPDLTIRKEDIDWVVNTLRKHGGRDAWETASRLCR